MVQQSMAGFRETLEDKANQFIGPNSNKQWDVSIPGTLRREIALTVDQIKRLRERHEEQFRLLLRIECDVGTELMQMDAQSSRDALYHFPERQKLKQQLFDIEKERRSLSLQLEEKTQSLENRLLSLINKHEQIDIRK